MHMPLKSLAQRHCAAHKPPLTLRGFVEEAYGVGASQFYYIAHGKREPSVNFLRRLNNAHVRLFPDNPVTVALPHCPPVTIGLRLFPDPPDPTPQPKNH